MGKKAVVQVGTGSPDKVLFADYKQTLPSWLSVPWPSPGRSMLHQTWGPASTHASVQWCPGEGSLWWDEPERLLPISCELYSRAPWHSGARGHPGSRQMASPKSFIQKKARYWNARTDFSAEMGLMQRWWQRVREGP